MLRVVINDKYKLPFFPEDFKITGFGVLIDVNDQRISATFVNDQRISEKFFFKDAYARIVVLQRHD